MNLRADAPSATATLQVQCERLEAELRGASGLDRPGYFAVGNAKHHARRQRAIRVKGCDGFVEVNDGFVRYVRHGLSDDCQKRGGVVKAIRALTLKGLRREVAQAKPGSASVVGGVLAEGDEALAK